MLTVEKSSMGGCLNNDILIFYYSEDGEIM